MNAVNRQEVAGPSTPVQLLGFDGIPQAGDQVVVVETERVAREISLKRQQLKRETGFPPDQIYHAGRNFAADSGRPASA